MSAEGERKQAFARIVSAYKEVFGDPAHQVAIQRVLEDLGVESHMQVDQGVFHPDPNFMYHVSGRRHLYQHILRMVETPAEEVDNLFSDLTDRQIGRYDPFLGSKG